MLAPFRFAGILAAILAACGLAGAQELAPAESGVSVHRLVIDGPSSHIVKYYVTGGSPRLQALVRRVEWAENELSVIEQLQRLKLDTVVNERRVAAFRTEQITNPYYPPDFVPPPITPANGRGRASPLQRSLTEQLAYQATPGAARQLIGFLEQVQTQLDVELKALLPAEQKATQGPIDALRQRVAALPRGGAAAPPRPKPVVPAVPSRVQQGSLPASGGPKAAVEVQWGSFWFAAEVLQVKGDMSLIRYTRWGSSADEWVPAARIRPATDDGGPAVPVRFNDRTALATPRR